LVSGNTEQSSHDRFCDINRRTFTSTHVHEVET
jgi:hypothetical protein